MHPDVKNWIKYARFEEKHGYFAHARKVYERAVEFFGDEHMDEHLYVAFAKFEENQKEVNKLNLIMLKNSLENIEFISIFSLLEKCFQNTKVWFLEENSIHCG